MSSKRKYRKMRQVQENPYSLFPSQASDSNRLIECFYSRAARRVAQCPLNLGSVELRTSPENFIKLRTFRGNFIKN